MKKFFSIVIAVAMLLTFASCGSSAKTENVQSKAESSSEAASSSEEVKKEPASSTTEEKSSEVAKPETASSSEAASSSEESKTEPASSSEAEADSKAVTEKVEISSGKKEEMTTDSEGNVIITDPGELSSMPESVVSAEKTTTDEMIKETRTTKSGNKGVRETYKDGTKKYYLERKGKEEEYDDLSMFRSSWFVYFDEIAPYAD